MSNVYNGSKAAIISKLAYVESFSRKKFTSDRNDSATNLNHKNHAKRR